MSIETLREQVKQAVSGYLDNELSEAEKIRLESIRQISEEDDGEYDDDDDDDDSSESQDDMDDDEEDGDKEDKKGKDCK